MEKVGSGMQKTHEEVPTRDKSQIRLSIFVYFPLQCFLL